jgi:uncharacterized protein YdhG (YjbR/CyaY superfamily)
MRPVKKATSRKASSAGKSSGPKTRRTPKNVEEYLSRIPDSARSTFTQLRAAIRAVVPRQASETISYGIPAFRHNGILVWFAGFSKHCSLFPTASVIATFKDELKGYSTSKGTVQFPNDQPLPTALVKKLVRARLAQSQTRQAR